MFSSSFFASVGLAVALAGPAIAEATDYAVPVEALTLASAPGGKFMEQGFSAGGYAFFSKTYSVGKSGLFSNTLKYNVRVDYRFLKSDQTPVLTGGCLITSETVSSVLGLVEKTTSGGLYGCTVKDQPANDFAFEVAVPPVRESGVNLGSVSFSADKAGDRHFEQIRAKLLYKGVVYEAVPTTYDAKRSISRIVDGYVITHDGKPVGRVDFKGNTSTKGTITAPVTETDGREAVIFMAAQLLAMPELNAGYMRNTLIKN